MSLDLVAWVSLIARASFGGFLLTRRSSWAKGFGVLFLGSVAVSAATIAELRRRGLDAGGKPLTPLADKPKGVPDVAGLGVLLQGFSA